MPLTDREWEVFLRMTQAGRLSAADISGVTGIPLDDVEHALAAAEARRQARPCTAARTGLLERPWLPHREWHRTKRHTFNV